MIVWGLVMVARWSDANINFSRASSSGRDFTYRVAEYGPDGPGRRLSRTSASAWLPSGADLIWGVTRRREGDQYRHLTACFTCPKRQSYEPNR